MEVSSPLLLTNQISLINPELSGHAPLFKFNTSINHKNNNKFKNVMLCVFLFLWIKRPPANNYYEANDLINMLLDDKRGEQPCFGIL